MKTNIHILPAICILCLCACKSGNASSLNKNDVIQDTIKTFTLPAIPPMMTAPEQRADFLVKHYWDNVNFADTNYIHHPEVTEQAWADYCDILNHVPLETAQEAMRKTFVCSIVFRMASCPVGNCTRSHAENNRTNECRQKSIHLHHRPGG